jgi:hypothetical protein
VATPSTVPALRPLPNRVRLLVTSSPGRLSTRCRVFQAS